MGNCYYNFSMGNSYYNFSMRNSYCSLILWPGSCPRETDDSIEVSSIVRVNALIFNNLYVSRCFKIVSECKSMLAVVLNRKYRVQMTVVIIYTIWMHQCRSTSR